MLSRFRRPEADLRIHIDRAVLNPGDSLDVKVDLIPKSSITVRSGQLELICTETCVQKTSSQYGTHYQKKSETRFRAGERFSDTGTLRSGVKYSTDLRLEVPPNAPRSIKGTNVRNIQPGISWEVRASLDVANARDLSESKEVEVVGPPSARPDFPQRKVEETGHRQCNLTLATSSGEVRSNDKLEGVLGSEMLVDVAATEVRVELVREEKFGNDAQEHIVDSVTLETDVSLSAESSKEWRFDLNVGPVDVPSLQTEKSYVRWQVKGILARAMRPDLRVVAELSADF